MYFLFDKQDVLKIKILELMESRRQPIFTLSSLQRKFSSSAYIIKKTIEALLYDIESFGLKEEIPLSFTLDGKSIFIPQSKKINLLELRNFYLEEAKNYVLLKRCFDENLKSYQQFSDEEYLNIETAFSMKKKLDKAFSDYDFEIDKNFHIVGDERMIRTFFYDLFHQYFSNVNYLYEQELEDEAMELIAIISPFLKEPFRKSQTLTFCYAYYITQHRMTHGHFLLHSKNKLAMLEEEKLESDRLFGLILQHLKKHCATFTDETGKKVEVPEDCMKSEAQSVLLYLYMMGFNPKDNKFHNFSWERRKQLSQIVEIWEECYVDFFEKRLPSRIRRRLKRRLFAINLRLLYLYSPHYYIAENMRMLNFPVVIAFTAKVVDKMAKNFSQAEGDYLQLSNFLFQDYFYVFLETLPTKDILPEVYFMIDFQNSTRVTHTKSFLNQKKYDNFIFTDDIEKADICLTDYLVVTDKPTILVNWLNPPTNEDYLILYDLINEIKVNKFLRHQHK
ncbi:Mga helix-turn-helix domain-containing protein [Pilibacter termitis]|uniref:Mga helix-turn-helix domain-containing protein n=1 Tax=Pilibacter termitis TaxID=263852 RepID=A0A1T4NCD7_9ENTE|nr:helix-turn-helix domain-containing protein [Pilibacter termitis]SJZ76884.1 Mga helix-turn-helix domain-containing protein [Pilibacter termitis]